MRELTFKGFLAQYVKSLSKENTTGLYKLAAEASKTNARLVEPMFLYALFSDKQDVLLRATKDARLRKVYTALLQTYTAEGMMDALRNRSGEMDEGYYKVWQSYQSYKNRGQTDDRTKELMRQKLKRLQQKNGVTNYRIYTDLQLNPGNLNAWLKHGHANKISLETARKALRYVENSVVGKEL